ncbi:hypothetical protein KAR50_00285 [Periweissella fabaria]|uniref:Uncharacterized protein n=1 Tax=Periweissella fabaria TaxID=546157 RepID=A0ABM8Z438_9LACO|nr:hypothetical protein [Periweissella fabaria]MCM0596298.1 hypothetical protein [Periweissella fabaria]CAH0415947.1 hypothetical protein WFA24289_00245 [Periweissella fabaria]
MNLKRLLALSDQNFSDEISEMSYNEVAVFNQDVNFNISVGIIPAPDYSEKKRAIVVAAMEDKIND